MFVRFRERKNDGREPQFAPAKLACTGRCADRHGQRIGPGFRAGSGCPERPRCRWRIEGELVPYRLLVSVVENRRIDGKVKQEHVADLGAIDGEMLRDFYAGAAPDWLDYPSSMWRSLRERIAFWANLQAVLSRLANRIDDVTAAKIKEAVHARIPMPTTDELATIPKWEAQAETERWQTLKDSWGDEITREQTRIVKYEEAIRQAHKTIEQLQPIAETVNNASKDLQQAIEQGDAEARRKLNEMYQDANLMLGEQFVSRARNS